MGLEKSFDKNMSATGGALPLPEKIEIKDATEKKEDMKILKDYRDANGNGDVVVLKEATPVRMSEVHQFEVIYKVSDKPGGTSGKQWEKMQEEDLGPAPITKALQ